MGNSPSLSKLTPILNKRICVDVIDHQITRIFEIEKYVDINNTISIGELKNALEHKTDVFLTHGEFNSSFFSQ
jgi:hypothetical protein